MKSNVIIRKIERSDCKLISKAFEEQGWKKPVQQFESYLIEQNKGERDVLVAEINGEIAGYLTIKWRSDYLPFQEAGIPEIVDFNVLKKYQRQYIGSRLMDEAENRIRKVAVFAGIGFGMYQDYGAAQILYIKRGYIPDGNGLVKDSIPVQYGETITLDDGIVFCLKKKL